MEIVLKIEEVKPGEKGGGEEGMVEDVKGEALNAHGQDTVALGEGVLESVAVVEAESEGQKTVAFVEGVIESEAVAKAERQKTVALVEGVLVSEVVVEAERQTAVALVEGVLVESGAVVEAGDGALVGVAPRAGAIVETERQTTVALVEGVFECGAVGVAGDVDLLEVAVWAGGAEREGGPVLEEDGLVGRFEVNGGDERGLWGGASLGNRLFLGRSASFQTAGMHGKDLLDLFGVGQQDEWYVVMSVAVPAQQVVARRQQQHDSSGLQRSFGGKLMRWTRRRAVRKRAARMEGRRGSLVFGLGQLPRGS